MASLIKIPTFRRKRRRTGGTIAAEMAVIAYKFVNIVDGGAPISGQVSPYAFEHGLFPATPL